MLDLLKVTVLVEDSAPYESPLLGQHGLSLFLEAEREGDVRRILVDVGQSPDTLLHNVGRLGRSFREIDAVVLTHCHVTGCNLAGIFNILKHAVRPGERVAGII